MALDHGVACLSGILWRCYPQLLPFPFGEIADVKGCSLAGLRLADTATAVRESLEMSVPTDIVLVLA